MERSEPTLIPEWLKGSGSVSGGSGTAAHQMASSSLHSDDHVATRPSRNKSPVSINVHDIGRSDRTTSSYLRRNSGSNSSPRLRSNGSFGRSIRDREWEWEKEIYDSRDKEKSVLGDHRRHEYSNPLESILPSRFDKDLRRSQSMTTGKRGETWPRKVPYDSINANKSNPNNSNGLLAGGSSVSSVHKTAFERDFPSLGAEDRQVAPEIGRVSSPGLSSAIQGLPIGTPASIVGDGWTSALAEVPVLVGNNGIAGSVQQAVLPPTSASSASSITTGMNMAETLAQGPSRAHAAPQLSSGTQRREELAIKQSRQLIPVTPSMPKASVSNSNPSEKPKPKLGQHQQHQISSSHIANHISRSGPVKSDVSKTSGVGKLHVLKPARERNGVSPTGKDSLSPTSVSRIASSPVVVAPSVVGSAPLRSPSNNPNLATVERKPAPAILEKRPTPQAKSRNDFFNLMRKKSMTSPTSAAPGPGLAVSSSVLDKSDETETGGAPVIPQDVDSPSSDSFVGDRWTEKRNDVNNNGINACIRPPESLNNEHKEPFNNGKDHSCSNVILHSEEEETAFLRSLGWEENAGEDEDEGLTEEEISSFYKEVDEYMKLRPFSRISLRTGSVGGGFSS